MKLIKLPEDLTWVRLETERDLADIDELLKLPSTFRLAFTTPLPRKIVVLYQGRYIGFDYTALEPKESCKT